MNTELVQHLRRKNIVVFTGAGISMGEPANMPSWYKLNDILLESLWNKVQKEYKVPQLIREQFMEDLRNARQQNLFSPDYQAQIHRLCYLQSGT
jgi:NAD-dependent SIR2 family protein deacetylase